MGALGQTNPHIPRTLNHCFCCGLPRYIWLRLVSPTEQKHMWALCFEVGVCAHRLLQAGGGLELEGGLEGSFSEVWFLAHMCSARYNWVLWKKRFPQRREFGKPH